MSKIVKTHSTKRESTARIRRGVIRAQTGSTGKSVVLFFDTNVSGGTGSWKDSPTGISKGYLNLFDSTWTQTASVEWQTTATARTTYYKGQIGAMVQDSNGDFHVVYNYRTSPHSSSEYSQGQSLRYRKITFNGTTLTLGSETVISSSAGRYSDVDIDVCGTVPVVVYAYSANAQTHVTKMWQSGGGITDINTISVTGTSVGKRGVSLAVYASGTSYSWVVADTHFGGFIDYGDSIFYGTGTTTTAPVKAGALATALNVNLNGGQRELFVYADGTSFIVTGAVVASPYSQFYAAYSVAINGAASTLCAPYVKAFNYSYVKAVDFLYSATQFVKSGGTYGGKVITYISDGVKTYAHQAGWALNAGVVTFTPVDYRWTMDTWYLGGNIAPASLTCGDRGTISTDLDRVNVVVNHPEIYKYIAYRRLPEYGTTSRVSISYPNDLATVNTSVPKLTFSVSGGTTYNVAEFVQTQIATDNVFTQNVVTLNTSTAEVSSQNTTREIQVQESTLTQGVYYTRCRMVDSMGYVYPWSATTSFTIKHIPTATILTPAPGAIIPYIGGYFSVSWQFGDSDNTDYQTAYTLKVYDDGGTAVYNSGKITSNASSATGYLASQYVDVPLLIGVSVFDSDDVESVEEIVSFSLGALPIVVFDEIGTGDVVNTSIPVLSWSNTFGGSRTQASYRLKLRDVALDAPVYDSNIVYTDEASLIPPAGIIKNLHNYTATVTVVDSAGLSSSASRSFSASWAVPDPCAAPIVDLSAHDEFGYAYITIIKPTGIDPADEEYITLKLWRRSLYSNNSWELVGSVDMPDTYNYSVIDSKIPSGVDSIYSVSMSVNNNGDLAEGDPNDSEFAYVTTSNRGYWLIDLSNSLNNLLIRGVTGDSYTDSSEQEIYHVINRGMVQEIGDDLGSSGTLTANIYDKQANFGGVPVRNYLSNPRFIADGTGLPLGLGAWSLADGRYIACKPKSPNPIGTENVFTLSPTLITTSLTQTVSLKAVGSTMFSMWVELSKIAAASLSDCGVLLEYYDSSNSLLDSESRSWTFGNNGGYKVAYLNGVGQLTPDYTSPVGDAYSWYRLDVGYSAPVGSVSCTITITFNATSGDALSIAGAMFIDSDKVISFFDGSTTGAEWISGDIYGPSFCPGLVTARSVRRKFIALSKTSGQLALRNPFGDIFNVAIGNIQVDRVAGVEAEYVSVSIPYTEIIE